MKVTIPALWVMSTFFSFLVFAHNPTKIEITGFDAGKNQLSIRVTHPVSSARDHYVKKIEVIVDGKEPIEKKFFFQKGDRQTLTLNIPGLGEAENITVKAYSNRGGSLEKDFSVEELKKEKLDAQ